MGRIDESGHMSGGGNGDPPPDVAAVMASDRTGRMPPAPGVPDI